MQADLGLSQIQFAWVFTVFYIAYGVCEIPTAWLGDRLGSTPDAAADRRMLVHVHRLDRSWFAACRAC